MSKTVRRHEGPGSSDGRPDASTRGVVRLYGWAHRYRPGSRCGRSSPVGRRAFRTANRLAQHRGCVAGRADCCGVRLAPQAARFSAFITERFRLHWIQHHPAAWGAHVLGTGAAEHERSAQGYLPPLQQAVGRPIPALGFTTSAHQWVNARGRRRLGQTPYRLGTAGRKQFQCPMALQPPAALRPCQATGTVEAPVVRWRPRSHETKQDGSGPSGWPAAWQTLWTGWAVKGPALRHRSNGQTDRWTNRSLWTKQRASRVGRFAKDPSPGCVPAGLVPAVAEERPL